MPRRDLQVGGKVYLSHDQEMVNEAAAATEVVHLRLKDFDANTNSTHSFFSTFGPDVLLEQLTQKMTEQGQAFEISNLTWKLNFNCARNLNEAGAAEEGAADAIRLAEQCRAQVEITKVPDQDKFCVNFQRKAGSAMLFYDNANKYIDLLELCNNTTLDD